MPKIGSPEKTKYSAIDVVFILEDGEVHYYRIYSLFLSCMRQGMLTLSRAPSTTSHFVIYNFFIILEVLSTNAP